MTGERRCPTCGADCYRDDVVCVKCGTNLKTGYKMEPLGLADEELTPSFGYRFLMWLGHWFPGLLRPSIIVVSLILVIAGFGVMGLCLLVFSLGAVISAFFIGAMGVVIYAQAIALVLVGEYMLLHEALAEMESTKWTIFFVILFTPIALGMVLMKMAADKAGEL